MASITAILLSLIIAGCSSSGSSKPQTTTNDYTGPVPELGDTVERACVAIGVLTAKAPAYGSKVLSCPGADQDMRAVLEMAEETGITNRTGLLSQAATWKSVKYAILKATDGFGPEDLLVLSLAGHGGWVKDISGDEQSGKDSTWCLYDGPVLDDDVWAFLCGEVPTCRILFLTDTCHSEGSWRRWVPLWDTSIPADLDSRGKQWAGTIVQFAACREAESALGGNFGGQWTSALYDARKASSVQAWYDKAKKIVENQTPTLTTYGPLADEMLAGAPLR